VQKHVSDKIDRLSALCAKHGVRSLVLFGSGATEDFDPATSDLDFVVDFQPGPRRGLDDPFFHLKDELEDLFGQSVDLIEQAAIANPYLRDSIKDTGETLYAA